MSARSRGTVDIGQIAALSAELNAVLTKHAATWAPETDGRYQQQDALAHVMADLVAGAEWPIATAMSFVHEIMFAVSNARARRPPAPAA